MELSFESCRSSNSLIAGFGFETPMAIVSLVIANLANEFNSSESSELSQLQPLSNCLDYMFDSPKDTYSDATLILATGQEVPFHRCILSARTPFFKTALATTEKMQFSKTAKLELKVIAKDYEVNFDSVKTVLAYVYKNTYRPPPEEISNCLDKFCAHMGCRPAVDFILEVLYLASIFQITELVTQSQNRLLEIMDDIRREDILVILKVANICGKDCKNLLVRCTRVIARSDVDIFTLEKSLSSPNQQIAKQVTDIRKELGLEIHEPAKAALRIYQALELKDFALVELLFQEHVASLEDVYALHYAVAYCNVKTTMNLLDLELVDVNRRSPKGYMAIHLAAMRKEPELIMLLLTKGALASETTSDGRMALMIAKQLTKEADYNKIPEKGKPSPRGRLCIEILEQANRQDALSFPSLVVDADRDELVTRLLHLENIVAVTRSLFPMEAQVAMSVGQVEGTCEERNITPSIIQEKHRSRLKALSRSVELVKCFFPLCWESVDSLICCEDLSDLPFTHEETPAQWEQKKKRLKEMQDNLVRDIEKPSSLAASSSSTSKSTAAMRRSRKRPYQC